MTTEFIPTQDNSRAYRDALGCFATGVTIVTAATPAGPIGMTANSFSSISLTPPLVLWSPSKTSQRYPLFAAASHFAIHVLRDDQRDLGLEFARRGDAFDRVGWHEGPGDLPLIDDCLARFQCEMAAIHDGGDHVIMVGRVARVAMNEGTPLVFAQSGYGKFVSRD